LTYEYLDQVLLPTLEARFSIQVERGLHRRAWSLGPQSRGEIWLKVQPLPPKQKLQFNPPQLKAHSRPFEVCSIDASIIGPVASHDSLQELLTSDLGNLFPSAKVNYKVMEDSRTDGRWYILLVATSTAGLRWGRDVVCGMPKKTKSREVFVRRLASDVCKELYKEVSVGGQVDEHLQDQVVCFQALTEGYSSFPRDDSASAIEHLEITEEEAHRWDVNGPFGNGSLHTRTARWVVHELLPEVEFYSNGDTVKGVGFSSLPG
jgi:RNA 3'-terminal phosphate cyclase (ATP)